MNQTLLFFILFLVYGCYPDNHKVTDQPAEHDLLQASDTFSYPEVSDEELNQAIAGIPQLSSFILYQNDEFLREQYSNGAGRNRFSNIKSASKSLISALTGIAISQGYIEHLDQPIDTWLGDYFEHIDDERKRDITVRHLLTMSTGLESTSFSNYGKWVVSPDWIAYALNAELHHQPGTRMVYSTGDSHLLAAVLTRAAGMDLRSFAGKYLLQPAGIQIGGWDKDPSGFYFGGNNMALTPGGLLEIGRLYLNKGMLNGKQILSKTWVEESLTSHFENISWNSRGHDYGYLWWHNRFSDTNVWFAWGYGGQYVFVVPELDAVVVFTANPDSRSRGLNNRIYALMDNQIVPWLYHANSGLQ